MASLPYVRERVSRWDEEVERTRYLVSELEKMDGVRQIGLRPKEHDLVRFETPVFHEIASSHPGGASSFRELKKRRIVGIRRGQTRWFKCSVCRDD